MGIDWQRDERGRHGTHLSRRALLRVAAAGGLTLSSAGLLAACGRGSEPAPASSGRPPAAVATAPSSQAAAPASGPAKKGGVWKLAVIADPVPYPITMPGALPAILACKTVYNCLVRYELKDNAIQVVPDLAESWSANDKLTEYTFKLRPDVKWHDGQPFTAADVKFTIDAQLDPKVNVWGRGGIISIQSVDILDDHTVKFTLKYPFAALPVMLGYNRAIAPKHLLDGQDLNEPTAFLKHPIGTGPFKFKQLSQGNFLEIEANPTYFGGAPMLDGIIYKVIPDGNARVAQLKAGEIDFTPIEPQQLDALSDASHIDIRKAPQVDYEFFAFNHKNPHFQDVRVRQALNYAIDKDALVKNFLKGYGQVATGPINPLLGDYYNPKVQTYPYDMAKAAALLDEAGWKKGPDGLLVNAQGEKLTIRFIGANVFPVMKQDMTYAQQQYQKLGLDVQLGITDWAVFNSALANFDYELEMSYWITPPDPDLYDHYYSGSGSNSWAYNNPAVDDLIMRARSEPDHARRVELYHQLQEKLAADLPVIFLYYPQEIQAVHRRTRDLPLIGYRDALTWMNKVWVDAT